MSLVMAALRRSVIPYAMAASRSVKSAAVVRPVRGLEEFFDQDRPYIHDDPTSGKVYGRSWEASELRLKSSEDLHKLWFVLLKERNLLLTLRSELYRKKLDWSQKERYHKVIVSMKRLKYVVVERDIAVKKIREEEKTDEERREEKEEIMARRMAKWQHLKIQRARREDFRLRKPDNVLAQEMNHLLGLPCLPGQIPHEEVQQLFDKGMARWGFNEVGEVLTEPEREKQMAKLGIKDDEEHPDPRGKYHHTFGTEKYPPYHRLYDKWRIISNKQKKQKEADDAKVAKMLKELEMERHNKNQ